MDQMQIDEISKAIRRMTDPGDRRVAPEVFESFVRSLEKGGAEKIQNLFLSISNKEFHDSIKKSIKDYCLWWIEKYMPYLSIQVGTLSGGVTKNELADLDPEVYKKRALEEMVIGIKKACKDYAGIALRKSFKMFFGEEISEDELERDLVDKVTAAFLSSLKKNFDGHRENVKNPKYDWEMRGANFPNYYLEGMYWERRISAEGKPAQKTEETITQESIEELKKDYENCVANVNQIREKFSLSPLQNFP